LFAGQEGRLGNACEQWIYLAELIPERRGHTSLFLCVSCQPLDANRLSTRRQTKSCFSVNGDRSVMRRRYDANREPSHLSRQLDLFVRGCLSDGRWEESAVRPQQVGPKHNACRSFHGSVA
jgi:hypothetical protein